MKTVRFHPEAEAEMIDAAVWYESRQATLGKRFVTTVQDALTGSNSTRNSIRSSRTMCVVA